MRKSIMMTTPKTGTDDLWAYGKLAYWLDVAEVIWPLVDNIRAAGIDTTDELLNAYLSGKFKRFKNATKRGLKQVANLLINLYGNQQTAIVVAYQSYTA